MRRTPILILLLAALAIAMPLAGCNSVQESWQQVHAELRTAAGSMHEFVLWYTDTADRLAADPNALTAREKADFLLVGRAIRQMSYGMNIALGADPNALAGGRQ